MIHSEELDIRDRVVQIISFFSLFFLWGKEGECIMQRDACAPCVGLQHGLPLGSSARWTIDLPSDLPTKTLPCRLARLHPVMNS